MFNLLFKDIHTQKIKPVYLVVDFVSPLKMFCSKVNITVQFLDWTNRVYKEKAVIPHVATPQKKNKNICFPDKKWTVVHLIDAVRMPVLP